MQSIVLALARACHGVDKGLHNSSVMLTETLKDVLDIHPNCTCSRIVSAAWQKLMLLKQIRLMGPLF